MTVLSYGLPADARRNGVVATEMDHPAAVMPWTAHNGERWRVIEAPSDDGGVIDIDLLSNMVDDRTAVVTATHVSHIHGTVQPVDTLAVLWHVNRGL